MEKILIICFSAEKGIYPFVQDIKDESFILLYVKTFVICATLDDSPVYIEIYRFNDDDHLSFYRCLTYDGKSFQKCSYLKPSLGDLKKFIEDYSFNS